MIEAAVLADNDDHMFDWSQRWALLRDCRAKRSHRVAYECDGRDAGQQPAFETFALQILGPHTSPLIGVRRKMLLAIVAYNCGELRGGDTQMIIHCEAEY